MSTVNQERTTTWKEVIVSWKRVVVGKRAVEFWHCEMEEFVELGEKFGLEGAELLAFVEKHIQVEKRET